MLFVCIQYVKNLEFDSEYLSLPMEKDIDSIIQILFYFWTYRYPIQDVYQRINEQYFHITKDEHVAVKLASQLFYDKRISPLGR